MKVHGSRPSIRAKTNKSTVIFWLMDVSKKRISFVVFRIHLPVNSMCFQCRLMLVFFRCHDGLLCRLIVIVLHRFDDDDADCYYVDVFMLQKCWIVAENCCVNCLYDCCRLLFVSDVTISIYLFSCCLPSTVYLFLCVCECECVRLLLCRCVVA